MPALLEATISPVTPEALIGIDQPLGNAAQAEAACADRHAVARSSPSSAASAFG